MICETVDELTPIIGTRPACRALGASPRRSTAVAARPSPGRPGRGRRPPGRCLRPSATAVLERAAQRAVRRQLAGAGVRDAARRGPLPGLGADDVPAAGGQARRCARAARPAHPPRLRQARAARRSGRTSCGRGTSRKLLGPAKWTYFYLYVILDVFSRYAVGWTVQYRETGPIAEGADRPGGRAAADRARPADGPRRPRRRR